MTLKATNEATIALIELYISLTCPPLKSDLRIESADRCSRIKSTDSRIIGLFSSSFRDMKLSGKMIKKYKTAIADKIQHIGMFAHPKDMLAERARHAYS